MFVLPWKTVQRSIAVSWWCSPDVKVWPILPLGKDAKSQRWWNFSRKKKKCLISNLCFMPWSRHYLSFAIYNRIVNQSIVYFRALAMIVDRKIEITKHRYIDIHCCHLVCWCREREICQLIVKDFLFHQQWRYVEIWDLTKYLLFYQ